MKTTRKFKKELKKYIDIKVLDIVVHLHNGKIIELHKNRSLVKNDIILVDKNNKKTKIPLSKIKHVDLFAA